MGANMVIDLTKLFDYRSPRSEKARIAYGMTSSLRVLLALLLIVCLVAGILLLITGSSLGWIAIGLAALPAMIADWYDGELHDLAPQKRDTPRIDDVLSGDILGMLSSQPTPFDVASVVGRVPEGQFFAIRFGISSLFLQDIASKDPTHIAALWQDALSIREKRGDSTLSAGVLIVALLRQFPQHEQLLAHLQLDTLDVMNGVDWYDHVLDIISKINQPRLSGGLARDWSFGWIPTLSRFGQNISLGIRGRLSTVDTPNHEAAVQQLMQTLGDGGRPVTLVGEQGVGKSQIVQTLADRLLDPLEKVPEHLRFHQIFMLDASAIVSAAPGRGEVEQLVTAILGEAYQAKNIILFLDHAEVFFQDGVGSVDISSVLLPVLEAGRLPIILSLEEQSYLKINKQKNTLANVSSRISIQPAEKQETIRVMQHHLIVKEYQSRVTYMYQALEKAYELSERYIHDMAMPGRALVLLDAAADYAESGLVTSRSVEQAIEQTQNIKVSPVTRDDERDTLLHLEDRIHERMINQVRAVSVVSDALRRARAGVRNQDRPIGTFLFVGPTGVGKTELAKALAGVYFGGEDHLIRLDLNEFVGAGDVKRLIADGADDPMSLTAQVMKQPFCVILLDEIEKAHPSVLSTLLQLLDEGILRDVKNREVSFKDAIIIGTSNAGADRIREQIERGLDVLQFEDQFVDELIDSGQFKPELLNRFDEIVMFTPLKKPELLQVVDLILAGLNKTLSAQKVTVTVTDDAKAYLVDAGYDPRLGARPLRRVVQRAVENIVAKQLLAGGVDAGSIVAIDLAQVKQIIDQKSEADKMTGARRG